MTFTYDLGSADELIAALSQVRFELGDTTAGQGVRASGANLSDEELTVLHDREGSDTMRTVAAACEMLARDWTRVASVTVGPRSQQFGTIAAQYAARAAELRVQYGGAIIATTGFSFTPARNDGYAQNADPYGAEYG